jgi:hypothetical protein
MQDLCQGLDARNLDGRLSLLESVVVRDKNGQLLCISQGPNEAGLLRALAAAVKPAAVAVAVKFLGTLRTLAIL